MAYFGAANGANNASTTTTITIPASLPTDAVLLLPFMSIGHTSGTAHPTVVDDNGGAAWTQWTTGLGTSRILQLWWKRYESGLSSKTITIDGAVTMLASRLVVCGGRYQGGTPITDFTAESNSAGDESHAGFTPTTAGSDVVFIVYNYADNFAVTSVSAATTGAAGTSGELINALTGDGCAINVSVWDNHPASGTGTITWAQSNKTTSTVALSLLPAASGSFQAAWARGSNVQSGVYR